uniref:spermatogenesis-associated protein 33 n=1 Tax=Jaculus jaculus TaxID=51337 RepID=UPI001E1B47E5|nr:spermatogenesis-associated protein 33 [Jaculus jaculus]
MGLSKSKSKQRKDEEQKRTPTHSNPPHSVPKAKDKTTEKEAKQGEKEALNQHSDNLLGSGSTKHRKSSASYEEKADAKQKPSKKKIVIPQIIITRASTETLVSYGPPYDEEQRTIREQTEWGPYYRHRNPSTIMAYEPRTKE